jgi:hypothetical protein
VASHLLIFCVFYNRNNTHFFHICRLLQTKFKTLVHFPIRITYIRWKQYREANCGNYVNNLHYDDLLLEAFNYNTTRFVKMYSCPSALTEHHAMKAYWGSESIAQCILASAVDGGKWSVSRPGRFTPKERDPGTHWIGGWVDPRTGLDTVVNRKIPSHCRDSNHRSSRP